MPSEAIFFNGVFEWVLIEILKVQKELPEQIMFLQPHSSYVVNHLRDTPPSLDAPTLLLMSLSDDLQNARYVAEIVGWDDKRTLSPERAHVINRLIWTLQPDEGGLFNESKVEGKTSANLLHVRRLRELLSPVPVGQLTKTDGDPVSDNRSMSGGWAYIKGDGLNELIG